MNVDITRVFILSSLLFGFGSFAQTPKNDSTKVDYNKILTFCLDGNVTPALRIFESEDAKKLSVKDLKFKSKFEDRFKGDTDNSDFLESRKSPVTDLLRIYRDYWRKSLIDNSKSYDTLLMKELSVFFASRYQIHSGNMNLLPDDTLDFYVKKYIVTSGYRTTGFGRTGKYLDLLVWKNQKDTMYNFSISREKIHTPVVFMDDFITVGWEEYATFGYAYPGGWATREALYCVRNAYDLKSENFLISYLCHEGRHFTDYKLFPNLESADLEYRAKLTELSLLSETLYETISNFFNNANYESENGHSIANYCVIRDMSNILFHVAFENDINKWKELSMKKIHSTANELLRRNTKTLNKLGTGVRKYIKQ
jgi:hypothetical protein